MHAQHQHRTFWARLNNTAHGFQAAHSRQGAIHDDDPRSKLLSQADCLWTIAGFTDHCNIRLVLQHAPKAAPHQTVIIDKQHRNFRWHANPAYLVEFSTERVCRLPAVLGTQWRRVTILRVLAWRQAQSPVWMSAPQILSRGLPLQVAVYRPRTAAAPKPRALPNGALHY